MTTEDDLEQNVCVFCGHLFLFHIGHVITVCNRYAVAFEYEAPQVLLIPVSCAKALARTPDGDKLLKDISLRYKETGVPEEVSIGKDFDLCPCPGFVGEKDLKELSVL